MDLQKEVKGLLLYAAAGLAMAYSLNLGLGYALAADKPIMAVVSSSMEPTFLCGDLVILRGAAANELREGDVIVFQNPLKNVPVVHRIVRIERRGEEIFFYTKGDNNATNSMLDQEAGIAPPIKKEWVKGKVVRTVPKLGWIKVITSGSAC